MWAFNSTISDSIITGDGSCYMRTTIFVLTTSMCRLFLQVLTCHLCPRIYLTQRLLTNHLLAKHQVGRSYQCHCGRADFRTTGIYKKHMQSCKVVAPETVPNSQKGGVCLCTCVCTRMFTTFRTFIVAVVVFGDKWWFCCGHLAATHTTPLLYLLVLLA